MDRRSLADELNRLLALEVRGLAAHLREATPHITPAAYAVWRNVQRILHADEAHAERLSDLLAKLDLPEQATSFDPDVADYHYADLAYLLPLLIEEQKKQIAAYQTALANIGSDAQWADFTTELQALLNDHQTQVDELEACHRKLAGGSVLAGRG